MAKKQDDHFASFYAHFPKEISQEIDDYVTNEVFVNSRYIFTRRVGNFQYGFCTHCAQEYITEEYLKPARTASCKKCGSKCKVKASGVSRKYLYDSAYIVYYEKSLINPNAIVARGIYVERDYRGDYYEVKTQYRTENLYLFEPGNSEMYWLASHNKWIKGDKVRSGFSDYSNGLMKVCSYESIKSAVEGTPFQYSTWEHYLNSYYCRDMVKFFDLYTKSPCVEFLTKSGMKYFVSAKLSGRPTYGAINWRGTKAQEVLKLDGQRLREIQEYRKTNGKLHPLTLRLQQIAMKDKSKLCLSDLQDIANTYVQSFEDLKKILKYTTLRRANAYIGKQSLIEEDQKRPSDAASILRTWRDYIADCLKLELDLTNERILFPRNLHKAHQYTLKQVKDRADELLNAKIQKRVNFLTQKYNFERGGLFIRPAYDANELIVEGKKLEHCVGRYAEDYAKGKTDLLFVRKISAPGKPFYTMEVQKDTVVQCRGRHNCAMTKDVREFVDVFIEEKLKKNKKNQPGRQEVAV
ncbi:PcfJ domain-containing protein [Brevibacillus borstelensis]|uniref:PcfJ domain-containing protein n=1 Tax=Brevibacillus borstelensis TaxID=45462 RepID=UPI0004F33ABF|nr:PcfJ domain-containing protein [Brevibacillus borstelensis]KKX56359.1 hypothetical protein X546_04555 [Brevibacillus borstelensis cifa_chp40]